MSSDEEDEPASATAAGGEEKEEKIVSEPQETDVLCGRGGAALRHPGNQTYRRLVNLNKGLYITCLKTEKLKISRSIVAAIREQNGRFLERDAKKGTWYDIGDKKAIEKTSQALREGQPKLRQKMVEMGGAPPGSGLPTEQQQQQHPQYGNSNNNNNNGIYNPQGSIPINGMGGGGFDHQGGFGIGMGPPASVPTPQHVMQGQHPQMAMQQQQHQQQQQQQQHPPMGDMPPPAARYSDSNVSDMMMQRLSLNNQEDQRQSLKNRPEFAGMGGGGPGVDRDSILSHPGSAQFQAPQPPSGGQAQQPPPPPPPPPPGPLGMESPSVSVRSFDRRRLFARMKYSRPASGRFNSHSQRSLGTDGMPDINMVDSNFSLMSNNSGKRDSGADALGRFSNHGMARDSDIAPSDYIGVGSRRSLMSGLSRISDTSDANSIFSDLSRKIGNVSTRSIAMSEISGIEEGFHEDFDESFSTPFDPLKAESSHAPTAMDFDG
jgi:hypothetical protein